ncbi:MAG: exonuclease domain-containing protein [Planctomycetota bacterium]
MDFVAFDVETANPDLASICQVGIVTFEDGRVSETWQTNVNPEDYFDPRNVGVHNITEETVKDSPNFTTIHKEVAARLSSRIIVSHTSFDRVSIARVCEKYDLPPIGSNWLDSARVVRRAWPEFSKKGYGLSNVARAFGIDFEHHKAHEDARAAGEILIRAIRETGLSVHDWLVRARQSIHTRSQSRSTTNNRCATQGNPEGNLYGEVVVFTGTLSIPRHEAAGLASIAGCEVSDSITTSTTLLVVGDQDVTRLAGHEKSSKHRKAEQLIDKGQPIRVLAERDFRRMVGLA